MKKTAVLAVLMVLGLNACAELKQAGRDIGHATKEATTEIGHATRDATRAVGHASRDAVNSVKEDIKD